VLQSRITSDDLETCGAVSDVRAQLSRLQKQLDALKFSLASDPALVEQDRSIDALVMGILKARRDRDAIFGRELFGEPAWDILLELYAAHVAQRRLSVTGVCYASAVPPTTALRWVERLEKEGWVSRHSDPLDGRRAWVTLTKRAMTAMQGYLQKVKVQPA